jgi:hypothetical protein
LNDEATRLTPSCTAHPKLQHLTVQAGHDILQKCISIHLNTPLLLLLLLLLWGLATACNTPCRTPCLQLLLLLFLLLLLLINFSYHSL